MKRHLWGTALLLALATLLSALGALGASVARTATDEAFYLDDSRRAVAVYLGREPGQALTDADETAVTGYIGLTREEQRLIAAQLAGGMGAQAADFESIDALNARERQHLRDVQRIIAQARSLSKALTALAALLAVAAAWTGAGLVRRARAALAGVLGGLALCALLAAALALGLRFAGFERLFVGMHEMLFTNDLWQLNPKSDLLIRMMPQPLFEAALSRVLTGAFGALAVLLVMLAALYGMVGGMIRKHLIDKESGATQA